MNDTFTECPSRCASHQAVVGLSNLRQRGAGIREKASEETACGQETVPLPSMAVANEPHTARTARR